MNKIGAFHAPASFAFRGKALTVQLFLPDGEHAVAALSLSYTVTATGGKGARSRRLRMLPADGVTARDSYSLYCAEIPAEDLLGGELFYSFLLSDCESESYTVPLIDLPDLPPLMLTELCCWGGGPCNFLEFYNPGEEMVDLFDFDLLLFADGKLKGRNRLADNEGVNLLPPEGITAFRFLSPSLFASPLTSGTTVADFYADMAKIYPMECDDIAEHAPTLMQATTAVRSGGSYQLAKGSFELQRYFFETYTYHIVPHGKQVEDALFSVTLNQDRVDIRRTRSVLLEVDPRTPREGKIAAIGVSPTPGYCAEIQRLPHFGDTIPPAILPIEPEGRYHLTEGDLKIRFAAVAEHIAAPTVYLRVGKTFRRFAATLANDGFYETAVPHQTLLSLGSRLEYYIEVTGGLYTASFANRIAPVSLRIVDSAGPLILSSYPAEGEVIERNRQPRIRIEFADFSGVNPRISIFCLDGRNCSAEANWGRGSVIFTPSKPLSYGKHVIEVSLRDLMGNRTYRHIDFSISDGTSLSHFCGEIHSHSAESDGTGLFDDAYRYARTVGKVDFFAVTDHSQYLTDEEYAAQMARAHAFSAKNFVALAGQEITWSHREGHWGHLNLIEVHDRFSALDFDLPTLYEQIAANPKTVAMFNHPEDLWGNFDDFRHLTPEVRDRICLIEIKGAAYDEQYALALTRGWYLSPFYNEDNHSTEWTTETEGTGVILAPVLTRENLLSAIRRRRTYSTTDRTLKLAFRVNGEWLGAVLDAPSKLTVNVDVATERQEGIGKLSLMTEDNITVAEVTAGVAREFSWQIELDPDFDYYYLKITNGDQYTVSAPVFVKGLDCLELTALKRGVSQDPEQPHAVSATFQNNGVHPLVDVDVDFYLTSPSGFALRTHVPFASAHLDRLQEGESHTVTCSFPDVEGSRRVTAVVSGKIGKHRFADTAYLLLTPAYISKILPLTSEERGEENPFPYLELTNPTCRDLALDGCRIERRTVSGRAPQSRETLVLDGYTIPAEGRLVIWRKPRGSSLTVDDFNARYGTSLAEGVDLIVTKSAILTPAERGCRVDFCQGETLLCRAAYGNYCAEGEVLIADLPIRFAPADDMTATAVRLPYAEGVLPLQAEDAPILPTFVCDLPEKGAQASDKREKRRKIITKLAHAPLVPLQAATLLTHALSALKDFLDPRHH